MPLVAAKIDLVSAMRATLQTKVRLFARLAELTGTRETAVEFAEGLTAGQAFALLAGRYPHLNDCEGSVMFAVNAEYVPPEHILQQGGELALIPPVSGGAGAL